MFNFLVLFQYILGLLCLVLDLKNLFSENLRPSQPLATTTKDKHNPLAPTQNLDREEEKTATTTHTKLITTHTKLTKTPSPTTYKNYQYTTTHTTTTTTKSEIKQNENQTQK